MSTKTYRQRSLKPYSRRTPVINELQALADLLKAATVNVERDPAQESLASMLPENRLLVRSQVEEAISRLQVLVGRLPK